MPILYEFLRRLEFVVRRLLHQDIPQLNELFRNGYIDDNTLQQVEVILTDIQRLDILQVLRQTLSGNYAVLEIFERRLRHRLTQNNNPVHEEMSGLTDNGNIVQMETEHQIDAIAPNGTCGDAEEQFFNSRELRNSGMGSPRANHGELRMPTQEVEPLTIPRSLPIQARLGFVEDSSLRSFGNSPPEEFTPRCIACGKNSQAIQTSSTIWSNITDIVKELNPQNVRVFLTEVNKYDSEIFNSMQFYGASANNIVNALQRCHLRGKCVLCLLNYALQRIGRSDLAERIKAFDRKYKLK